MKTIFTKEYIINNKGCYTSKDLEDMFFEIGESPSLKMLFDYLPIKDFVWFLTKKTELSKEQLAWFSLRCAFYGLPFYEKKYPNDSRVKSCLECTEGFLKGNKSVVELKKAMDDAYNAYAAAGRADATCAFDAAADAYTAAAYAAAGRADATHNGDSAYTDTDVYKVFIWEYIEENLLNNLK
jgi:hypothetical protein